MTNCCKTNEHMMSIWWTLGRWLSRRLDCARRVEQRRCCALTWKLGNLANVLFVLVKRHTMREASSNYRNWDLWPVVALSVKERARAFKRAIVIAGRSGLLSLSQPIVWVYRPPNVGTCTDRKYTILIMLYCTKSDLQSCPDTPVFSVHLITASALFASCSFLSTYREDTSP